MNIEIIGTVTPPSSRAQAFGLLVAKKLEQALDPPLGFMEEGVIVVCFGGSGLQTKGYETTMRVQVMVGSELDVILDHFEAVDLTSGLLDDAEKASGNIVSLIVLELASRLHEKRRKNGTMRPLEDKLLDALLEKVDKVTLQHSGASV